MSRVSVAPWVVVIELEGIRVLRQRNETNCLDQTTQSEVLLDDDVIDSRHHEADLSSVGGAGEVSINLLGLMLIQADESVEDVVASRSIVVTTLIVGKIVLHRADG
uniref:Uncharacterized protein n=1 Tax=Photinus pyralis TaxID=7054 RepID=A0A1Y1LSX1_PHOPY